MPGTDHKLKDAISDLLGSWGLEAEHLEERDEQTPDPLAVYRDERYIIGIKSKRDNEELLRAEKECLAKVSWNFKHIVRLTRSGCSIPSIWSRATSH